MGKKKVIIREDSYKLNDYSAAYLRMLENRLDEFITDMKPAFKQAQKHVPFKEGKMNFIQNSRSSNARFVDTPDLYEWLIHKKTKLAEFATKVEAGERNLSDKPLTNLRHIRAFFSRFESVAKDKYHGITNFEVTEPKLANILLEKFVPARDEGGIFALTRYLLKDEDFHSKDDLGKIRNLLRVGKTITYVVAAQIKMTQALQPPQGEVDDLAHPLGDEPEATAATKPKAKKAVSEELDLQDQRREKPLKAPRIKPRNTIDKNQPELNLR